MDDESDEEEPARDDSDLVVHEATLTHADFVRLVDALAGLGPWEYQAITLRFGIDRPGPDLEPPMSLEAVSRLTGFTRESLRTLEAEVLRRYKPPNTGT